MSKNALNTLGIDNPETLAVSQSIGSDNILTSSAKEIMKIYKDENNVNQPTLSEALRWWLKDVSGNAYDAIMFSDGKICEVRLNIWEEDD